MKSYALREKTTQIPKYRKQLNDWQLRTLHSCFNMVGDITQTAEYSASITLTERLYKWVKLFRAPLIKRLCQNEYLIYKSHLLILIKVYFLSFKFFEKKTNRTNKNRKKVHSHIPPPPFPPLSSSLSLTKPQSPTRLVYNTGGSRVLYDRVIHSH